MEMEMAGSTNDVIAMNLTIAALEEWLKTNSERNGADLGREIGAMYREIHTAVDEMSPEEDDDFDFDDEEDDEEDEEAEVSDERD